MARQIWANEYLTLADKLAGRGAGKGRPRTAELRRASSTAYYALFHMLAKHGASWVYPHSSEEERGVVTRWFTHTNMRRTSEWVGRAALGQSVPKGVDSLLTADKIPQDLVLLARSFIDLQNIRHKADYDHFYVATRSETLRHVTQARAAVAAGRRLDGELAAGKAEARLYGLFLLLCLGGERMIKNND